MSQERETKNSTNLNTLGSIIRLYETQSPDLSSSTNNTPIRHPLQPPVSLLFLLLSHRLFFLSSLFPLLLFPLPPSCALCFQFFDASESEYDDASVRWLED
jgi:hypothetical protein